MARFHNVSSIIKLEDKRWDFDLQTTLFEPLKMAESAFAEDPEGYGWLQQTGKGLNKTMEKQVACGKST